MQHLAETKMSAACTEEAEYRNMEMVVFSPSSLHQFESEDMRLE
jgi:hypothetical protein